MNSLLKIILVFVVSLVLYLNIGIFLKKSGIYEFQLYNFVSYNSNEYQQDEDEGSMAYFESEFEQQPYRLPYDSSLKMLKLSILLILVSFILREFYIKKYG